MKKNESEGEKPTTKESNTIEELKTSKQLKVPQKTPVTPIQDSPSFSRLPPFPYPQAYRQGMNVRPLRKRKVFHMQHNNVQQQMNGLYPQWNTRLSQLPVGLSPFQMNQQYFVPNTSRIPYSLSNKQKEPKKEKKKKSRIFSQKRAKKLLKALDLKQKPRKRFIDDNWKVQGGKVYFRSTENDYWAEVVLNKRIQKERMKEAIKMVGRNVKNVENCIRTLLIIRKGDGTDLNLCSVFMSEGGEDHRSIVGRLALLPAVWGAKKQSKLKRKRKKNDNEEKNKIQKIEKEDDVKSKKKENYEDGYTQTIEIERREKSNQTGLPAANDDLLVIKEMVYFSKQEKSDGLDTIGGIGYIADIITDENKEKLYEIRMVDKIECGGRIHTSFFRTRANLRRYLVI